MGATPDPRLVPLAPREWPDGMKAALAALRPAQARHPFPAPDPSRPKGLNILGTLALHPDLTTAYHTFNGHLLFATTLTVRHRELVILRVAAVRGAEYEWRQHVVLAADAGITDDEVRRIASGAHGSGDGGWSELEAALLRAVDELVAGADVSDATWAALSAGLDTQQLMDMVFTVGAYDLLAMAMRTFRIPLDDDLADRK